MIRANKRAPLRAGPRLRMLISVISAVLLILFHAQTAYSADSVAPGIIRVKLSLNNPSSVPVFIDGNYSLAQDSGVSLQRQLYTVELEGGQLKLCYGGSVLYSGPEIKLVQHAATVGRNNFLWLNNYEHGYRGYSGDLYFSVSGSAVLVANNVYMEEYLCGVVPYEMSDAWPAEALKAQAIAARTYAARRLGSSGVYDVVDTSHDQVYKGCFASNINSAAAINATSGMVLKIGSAYADAYYSASNGGYTEIPYHAWGGGYELPYLIQADPYDLANPSSPYEEIFFPASITAENPVTASDNVEGTPNTTNAVNYIKHCIFASGLLQAQGYEAATISDFELKGVTSLVPHTLDADNLDPHKEDHNRIPLSGVNNCVDYIMATGSFVVSATKTIEGVPTASEATVESVELDLRYLDGANGDATYKAFNMSNLRLFIIEARMSGETLLGYSIYQRRYGHGVGMSQRGAQQRANSGQLFGEILAFYYHGTVLESLGLSAPSLTSISIPDNSNAKISCDTQLNVRSGAGTGYSILGVLPKDARIEVVQPYATTDWHKINYGGQNAYVHRSYVSLDEVVAVTGISLSASSITLGIGDTAVLTATVSPALATNKNIVWTSSDSSVASVSDSGQVQALAGGTAVITATTVDGSFAAGCTVNVPAIMSDVYSFDSVHTMILGIKDETSVEQFKSNLSNDPLQIVIYDSSGIEYTGGYVGTGMSAVLVIDSVILDQLDICVLGDVSGDGIIDIMDYTYVRLDIFDLRPLDGVYYKAGDVSGDEVIDIMDYTYIRLDIFDLRSIN